MTSYEISKLDEIKEAILSVNNFAQLLVLENRNVPYWAKDIKVSLYKVDVINNSLVDFDFELDYPNDEVKKLYYDYLEKDNA